MFFCYSINSYSPQFLFIFPTSLYLPHNSFGKMNCSELTYFRCSVGSLWKSFYTKYLIPIPHSNKNKSNSLLKHIGYSNLWLQASLSVFLETNDFTSLCKCPKLGWPQQCNILLHSTTNMCLISKSSHPLQWSTGVYQISITSLFPRFCNWLSWPKQIQDPVVL